MPDFQGNPIQNYLLDIKKISVVVMCFLDHYLTGSLTGRSFKICKGFFRNFSSFDIAQMRKGGDTIVSM